jgi:trigger factor
MTVERHSFPAPGLCTLELFSDAQEFGQAIQRVYETRKHRFAVEGWPRGQAPRAAIEAARGADVFWYDAVNLLLDEGTARLLDDTCQALGLEPVSTAQYELLSVDAASGVRARATFVLRPAMRLKADAGFTAQSRPLPVQENEVERRLTALRNRHFVLLPCDTAARGCVAEVRFTALAGGKPFPGGDSGDQPLRIDLDQGGPISGFAAGLLGRRAGETFSLSLRLPARYPAQPALGGLPAEYRITLERVYRKAMPELTDALVRENTDCSTVEQLREKLFCEIRAEHAAAARRRAQNEILLAMSAGAEGEIPAALTEQEAERRRAQLEYALVQQHSDLPAYCAANGLTPEALQQRLDAEAHNAVRDMLAALQIAHDHGFTATAEELEQAIEKKAAASHQDPARYRRTADRAAVRREIQMHKAVEYVLANSTIAEA